MEQIESLVGPDAAVISSPTLGGAEDEGSADAGADCSTGEVIAGTICAREEDRIRLGLPEPAPLGEVTQTPLPDTPWIVRPEPDGPVEADPTAQLEQTITVQVFREDEPPPPTTTTPPTTTPPTTTPPTTTPPTTTPPVAGPPGTVPPTGGPPTAGPPTSGPAGQAPPGASGGGPGFSGGVNVAGLTQVPRALSPAAADVAGGVPVGGEGAAAVGSPIPLIRYGASAGGGPSGGSSSSPVPMAVGVAGAVAVTAGAASGIWYLLGRRRLLLGR